MTVKQGWTGRVFEDFEVGDAYQHPLGRTVIAADNIWFTLLTQNTNPIHFDAAYSAQTEYGKPLVDSTFTLALVTGQSVSDVSQNAMANLGWDEVRLPNPLFEGDTVYSQSEVLDKRESKSRPDAVIVHEQTWTGTALHADIVLPATVTPAIAAEVPVPLRTTSIIRRRTVCATPVLATYAPCAIGPFVNVGCGRRPPSCPRS